jgi:hypothetical protein
LVLLVYIEVLFMSKKNCQIINAVVGMGLFFDEAVPGRVSISSSRENN